MERLGVIVERCAVFTGRRAPTSIHHHHAIEIDVCLGGSIELVTAERRLATSIGYVVGAGVPHRIAATRGPMLIVYLDPGDAAAATPPAELGDTAAARARDQLAAWQASGGTTEHARALVDGLRAALGVAARPRRIDARVGHARDRLTEHPGAARVEDVARQLGVSRGHLAELFGRETGTTMRAWRKWHRLCAALVMAFEGRSLTLAAHAAGFSDAAHMTRTCREMFGVPPSRFVALDRIVVA